MALDALPAHGAASAVGSAAHPGQPQQQRAFLGSEVKRLVGDRSGGNMVKKDPAARPLPRSRAAAAAIAASGHQQGPPEVIAPSQPTSSPSATAARAALADARELHREGRDEEAVDVLVEWLDGPAPESGQDLEMKDLSQAMVALGCWLCNNLATRHLHVRRVARAFGYTTTCERWLALRQASWQDGGSEDMWARLRYDRALNAAELAQSSGDRAKAIILLRECERLQETVPSLPDPEAPHLCLAEVLLQSGRLAEAATAAVHAMKLLRSQPIDDEERKVYGLLFALSLEQAALAAMATPSSGPPRLRALRCLPDAEATWALTAQCDEGSESQGVQAARALLQEMRNVHGRLLQQAANAHSAAHAEAQRRPWTSPAAISVHEHRLPTSPSKQKRLGPVAAAAKHKQLQEDLKKLQRKMRSFSPTNGNAPDLFPEADPASHTVSSSSATGTLDHLDTAQRMSSHGSTGSRSHSRSQRVGSKTLDGSATGSIAEGPCSEQLPSTLRLDEG